MTKKIDMAAAGLIVVIVLLSYFLFFRTERLRIHALEQEKTALSEKLNASGGATLALDRMTEEIQTIQANLDHFENQLPDEGRIHDFLRILDRLARNHGVHLQSVTPGTRVDENRHARILVSIAARSGFGNFYRFLYALEGIERITKFDPDAMSSQIAGELKGFDPKAHLDAKEVRRTDPFVQYALVASRQAYDQAGLSDVSLQSDSNS